MNEDLKKVIDRVRQWNVEELERRDKDITFTDVRPSIAAIHKMIMELGDNPEVLDTLPFASVQTIEQTVPKLVNAVEEIKRFKPAAPGASDQKRRIAEQIYAEGEPLLIHLKHPLAIHLIQKKLDPSNMVSLTEALGNRVQEANAIVAGLRDTTLKSTTGTSAEFFDGQARRNFWSAWVWTVPLTAVAIFICWFTWHFLVAPDIPHSNSQSSNPQQVQQPTTTQQSGIDKSDFAKAFPFALSKFAALSILLVLFYQIAKNRNANMHNHTVNRFRANCLKTLGAMLESTTTNDKDTRKIILISGARTIFEPTDTGYITAKERKGSPPETFNFLEDKPKS